LLSSCLGSLTASKPAGLPESKLSVLHAQQPDCCPDGLLAGLIAISLYSQPAGAGFARFLQSLSSVNESVT
jgi:hypothetical protein